MSEGAETGHGEIVAWSFELDAWFALTRGRLGSVRGYAEAGIAAGTALVGDRALFHGSGPRSAGERSRVVV